MISGLHRWTLLFCPMCFGSGSRLFLGVGINRACNGTLSGRVGDLLLRQDLTGFASGHIKTNLFVTEIVRLSCGQLSFTSGSKTVLFDNLVIASYSQRHY